MTHHKYWIVSAASGLVLFLSAFIVIIGSAIGCRRSFALTRHTLSSATVRASFCVTRANVVDDFCLGKFVCNANSSANYRRVACDVLTWIARDCACVHVVN